MDSLYSSHSELTSLVVLRDAPLLPVQRQKLEAKPAADADKRRRSLRTAFPQSAVCVPPASTSPVTQGGLCLPGLLCVFLSYVWWKLVKATWKPLVSIVSLQAGGRDARRRREGGRHCVQDIRDDTLVCLCRSQYEVPAGSGRDAMSQ